MVKNDHPHEWAEVDQPFETEDDDLCPLCMEELDISDLNFRPCPCGYRICRFCWHHIKEDLNRRCPGCRKEYDDSVVEFKPMKPEELKRLQQAKKQRDKERKDLELVNRKHLANVRVKQKNQVHVQGLTTKIANEDTLAQLKTSELFSQHGRIQKMFMSRRTGSTNLYTPDPRYQHVNLYINFSRNNEALNCIQSIDGLTLPDGHRLKATLGSTKYCASFLRGIKCTNDNCTGAHELAEEVEVGGMAAREEMSTARHAQKESEHRFPSKANLSYQPSSSSTNSAHAIPSGVALPATASWAARSTSTSQPASPAPAHSIGLNSGPSNVASTSRSFPKPASTSATAKSAHPLPPKPRTGSSEDVNARTPGSSNAVSDSQVSNQPSDAAAITNQQKASSLDLQPLSSQKQLTSSQSELAKDPDSVMSSESGPSSLTATASKSSSNNYLLSSHSHPPGLLPPGLTPDSLVTTVNRSVPSLPPGLGIPCNSNDGDSNSKSWRKSLEINSSLDLKRPGRSLIDSLSDDFNNVLSSFSPNFGDSRFSIFSNMSDNPLGSSKPFAPLGYSGTFNPFAETDFLSSSQSKDEETLFDSKQDLSSTRTESSLNDRRGSRFGFARRDSSSTVIAPSGIASSPLRSIFSHQNDDSGSSKPLQNSLQRPDRATPVASTRAQDSLNQLDNNAGVDRAPDASVLFPGVNLAASYSANAFPAAIARGVRSSGAAGTVGLPSIDSQIGSFQALSGAVHPRDSMGAQHSRVNERLALINCQAALSPTSFTHIHPSNHHEHMNPNLHGIRERRMDLNAAGYNLSAAYLPTGEMNPEFQDPAILNMRMTNNTSGNNGPYVGSIAQSGGEGGNHRGLNEIHPPFSMSNTSFNQLLANRPNAGGYRPNGGPAANNMGAGAENVMAGQFGFQGVLHQQNGGVNGPSNSINGGAIGGRLQLQQQQQQQQPGGQAFYHQSTGGLGTVVGGGQGGLMGRW